MKTLLNILGYFSLSNIIIGSLFKIQHYPGAGVMLVFGTLIFAFLFLPIFFFYSRNQAETKLNRLVNFVLVFVLWTCSIGMLFKIQHYPGAGVMLVIGSLTFAGALLPLLLYKSQKEKNSFSSLNILKYLMVSAGIAMSLAVNIPKEVMSGLLINSKILYFNNKTLYNLGNVIMTDSLNNSKRNEKIIRNTKVVTDELLWYIDELENKLINQFPENQLFKKDSFNLLDLTYLDNYDISTTILIGADPTNPKDEEFSAIELKRIINGYKNILLEYSNSEELRKEIEILLNTNPVNNGGYKSPWEVYHFYHAPLASVILSLESIKNSSLTARALVVNARMK